MESETVSELLSKALKRQDELRAEFEALQGVIAYYRQKLSRPLDEDGQQASLDLTVNANSLRARSAYVARLMDEVRRIIIQQGRPMKRGELVKQLESKGFPIEGSDKAKVLGTNIWRSGKFETVEGEGYWPNDVPRRSTQENR